VQKTGKQRSHPISVGLDRAAARPGEGGGIVGLSRDEKNSHRHLGAMRWCCRMARETKNSHVRRKDAADMQRKGRPIISGEQSFRITQKKNHHAEDETDERPGKDWRNMRRGRARHRRQPASLTGRKEARDPFSLLKENNATRRTIMNRIRIQRGGGVFSFGG